MALQLQILDLLDGENEDSRLRIARLVGERLSIDDLPASERMAAEALARSFVEDAIEQVRRELSKAIRHAKSLPREIALKIAHDVDSVACPFLEVTEVFSDADWQQLVLTISRGARIAVAHRTSMSEGLALALTEFGDSVVAETLVQNPAAPMTPSVCHSLIERSEDSTWILEKLTERDGLSGEIVTRLYSKVSAAARKKLAKLYELEDYTDPIGIEAEYAAVFRLVRKVPEPQQLVIAERLRRDGKLSDSFLLYTLREGLLTFFAATMSAVTTVRFESVRDTIRRGGMASVIQLLREARIPGPIHDAFWDALQVARSNLQEPECTASAEDYHAVQTYLSQ